MTVEQRRRKIVDVLKRDAHSAKLAECIDRCLNGKCDRCGDLCPVRARKWADANAATVAGLLASLGPEPILQLRYTRETWSRRDGELALSRLSTYQKQKRRAEHEPVFASLVGVEKALRRAFDKPNEPKVMAFGMIDAWQGYESWQIGASLIVAGIEASKLYDNFPAGEMDIKPVSDTRRSLRALLVQCRRAKLMPPLDAVMRMPRRRKQEYFAWLANMEPNARLFLYGCDRYFNRLPKEKRPEKLKQTKGRPNPHWLDGYKFGNHREDCQCRVCCGMGKREARGR